MPTDTVVKNGRIVTTEGIFEGAGVAVEDGKITMIAKDPLLPSADQIIDVQGKHVLPGVIDPHVHLGIYLPFESDMETETAAAAAGGVTTVLHHTFDKRSIRTFIPEMMETVRRKAHMDVGFTVCLMGMEHIQELEEAFKLGVTSFKAFLNRPEYEPLFGIRHPDDGELVMAMERLRNLGGLMLAHCENYEVIAKVTEKLKKEGRVDVSAWTDARPAFCEYEAMMKLIYFAKITRTPTYIVHMSIGDGVELVGRALSEGMELYAETCPHYLSLTSECPVGKVAPPLRTREDGEKLWAGISQGLIHTIGSDHAPMKKERKLGKGDVWSMGLGGVGGVETLLPVMLNEGVNKRNIPLDRVVEVCSLNPARIFGMPNKGSISIGKDADLVVVDLKKKVKVKPEVLHSAADYTPYDGWEFTGWPIMTMLRGKIVVKDGEIVGKPGDGQAIRRTPRRTSK